MIRYEIKEVNYEKVAQLGIRLGFIVPRLMSPIEEYHLYGDYSPLGLAFVRLCRESSYVAIRNVYSRFGEILSESQHS